MVHIRRRDVPQSLVIALVVVVPYEALHSRYKLFQAVVDKDVDLSPNPPKDRSDLVSVLRAAEEGEAKMCFRDNGLGSWGSNGTVHRKEGVSSVLHRRQEGAPVLLG